MPERAATPNLTSFARSGAAAGAFSAFVFTAVHHLFISDIWFSLPMMLAAGAVCGLCLAWSYALVASRPTARGWLGYNALYVAMLALLGLASILTFEPITTIAALIAANGPPEALIRQAFPMTAAFTLGAAIIIGRLHGRRWQNYAALLLTTAVLVALLGLNVSVIGLVSIPRSALYLVAELFALILVLAAVFAGVFLVLERKTLRSP